MTIRSALCLGLTAGLGLVAGVAASASEPANASAQGNRPIPTSTGSAGPGEHPAEHPAAEVALEQLLKLPSTLDYSVPRRGGANASEWRERFTGARAALDSERAALAATREELEKVASSTETWQVGPPIPGGGGASDAPLDYRLRQKLRRHRRSVEGLERAVRELEVEANLASVPEDWRE